jgi:hypothetical protein
LDVQFEVVASLIAAFRVSHAGAQRLGDLADARFQNVIANALE